jgi:hypothetical protein
MITSYRFSSIYKKKEIWLAITIITWKTKKTNNISLIERCNR